MYFRDSVIARTAELDIFPVACTMFACVWASDMMSRRMLKRPLLTSQSWMIRETTITVEIK